MTSSKKKLNYSSQGLGYDHNYILRGSVAYDVPAGLQAVAKAASWKLGEVVKPETGTPPKMNMEPESELLEEEIPIKNPSFSGSMLIFGGVQRFEHVPVD